MTLNDLTPLTTGLNLNGSARSYQTVDGNAARALPLHLRYHMAYSVIGATVGDRESIDSLSVCLLFGVNESSLAESVEYAWGEESNEIVDQLGIKQYNDINRAVTKLGLGNPT